MSKASSSGGQHRPYNEWHPEDKIVILELEAGKNFHVSPSIIPLDWGVVFVIYDFDPSCTSIGPRGVIVPGPYKFESKPLQKTVSEVDEFHVLIRSEPSDGHSSTLHASSANVTVKTFDIYSAARRGRRVLMVQTLWYWLSPWKTTIQAYAKPGAELYVLDSAGGSRIEFCARGGEE